MTKKVILFSNTGWSIYNYRRNLITNLIKSGYEVHIISPDDEYSDKIQALGCKLISIKLSQNGTSLLQELRSF